MIPHDPFKAGQKKLSAALLNQIVRELMERGVWDVEGADFAQGVTGRQLSIPSPKVEFWAMLTGEGADDGGSGGSGGNTGSYAWVEVERRSREDWTVVPNGRSGTAERDYARDINGTEGIPAGTVVLLSKGHASFVDVVGTANPVGRLNQEWLFDHCCPDDGGGAGGGSGDDAEGECCIAQEKTKCVNNNLVTTTTYTRIKIVDGKLVCTESSVPCGETAGKRYACVDGTQCMEDPNGAYATLEECQAACGIVPGITYNCAKVDGRNTCVDPGDGKGQYPTLSACQAACVEPCTGTCTHVWFGQWVLMSSDCSRDCGCAEPPYQGSAGQTVTSLCLDKTSLAKASASGRAVKTFGDDGLGDFGFLPGDGGGGPLGGP